MILVIDKTEARGGIVHEVVSSEPTAASVKGKRTVIKTTDPHPALTKEMNALVGKADYLVRSVCAYTTLGWVLSDNELMALQQQYQDIEVQAAILNAKADRLGAIRRVHAELAPMAFIDPTQGRNTVRESAFNGLLTLATILESQHLRDDMTTSRRSPWRPALLRLNNIETVLESRLRRRFEYLKRLATEGRSAFLDATRNEHVPTNRLKALMMPYVDELREGAKFLVG